MYNQATSRLIIFIIKRVLRSIHGFNLASTRETRPDKRPAFFHPESDFPREEFFGAPLLVPIAFFDKSTGERFSGFFLWKLLRSRVFPSPLRRVQSPWQTASADDTKDWMSKPREKLFPIIPFRICNCGFLCAHRRCNRWKTRFASRIFLVSKRLVAYCRLPRKRSQARRSDPKSRLIKFHSVDFVCVSDLVRRVKSFSSRFFFLCSSREKTRDLSRFLIAHTRFGLITFDWLGLPRLWLILWC